MKNPSPILIDLTSADLIHQFFGGASARIAPTRDAARAIYASHLVALNRALSRLGEGEDTDAAKVLNATGDELAALLQRANPADYFAIFLRNGHGAIPDASLAMAAAACRGFGLDVQTVLMRVVEVLTEKAAPEPQQAYIDI